MSDNIGLTDRNPNPDPDSTEPEGTDQMVERLGKGGNLCQDGN